MRLRFFNLLSVLLVLNVHSYSQNPMGIKTDVNGLPLNGVIMDFNFAPKKKLILKTEIQDFAKGKIRLKDESVLSGYIKNINGNFHFKKNVDDIEVNVISGRQINSVTIGQDSTKIVYSAYVKGKMTKRKYSILSSMNYGNFAFGEQIVNRSGRIEELFFYKEKTDNYWSTYNTAVLEDIFINDSIYSATNLTLLKQKNYNYTKGILTYNSGKQDTVFYYISNKSIKYKKLLTTEFETELIPYNFKTLVSVQDSIFTVKSILEKGKVTQKPLVLGYKCKVDHLHEYAQSIGVTRPQNFVFNKKQGLWETINQYQEVNEKTVFSYHQRSTFWGRMIKNLTTHQLEDRAITNADDSVFHGQLSTFELRNNRNQFNADKIHRFFKLKNYYDSYTNSKPFYFTKTWHPTSEKTSYKGKVTAFNNRYFTITYYQNNEKIAVINYGSNLDQLYTKIGTSSFYSNKQLIAQYKYDLKGNVMSYNIFYPGSSKIFYSYHIVEMMIERYHKNFYYPTFDALNDANGNPVEFENQRFSIADPYTKNETDIQFSYEKLIFLSRVENNQRIYSYTDQIQELDFSPIQRIIDKYMIENSSLVQESIDKNCNGHYFLSMILNEKGKFDKIEIIGSVNKDVDQVVKNLTEIIQKKGKLTPYMIHIDPVKVELIIPLITELKNQYTLHNHSVARPDMNYVYEQKAPADVSEYIEFEEL
ncbi:hypothetical protein [Flammeovirga sp. EKP202]|uniref:hypothetical protein n=1 Tax=Flammeovirga sp. EKP202 TaxID=2770592 RepID=UPI00165F0185|nr:hypothetical protein [Flammeovirga sp. EKP202]MBD0404321.1 hypothetical protein [Flammeovirga sp. EKP202]